jgi:hypothetical protein
VAADVSTTATPIPTAVSGSGAARPPAVPCLLCPALAVLMLSSAAQAQMPLTIEQLIVDRGRVQAFAAADYASETPFPGAANRSGGFSAALRYGITPDWEVNIGARRESASRRTPGVAQEYRRRQYSAAVTWQFRREDRFPAALLSLRGWQAREGAGGTDHGAEATLTMYRSLDPVVLSLQCSVGMRQPADGAVSGDLVDWRIAPQLNFAVNHRVTLLGGLSYARRALPGSRGSLPRYRESLALRTGVAFAAGQRDTVFVIGDSAPGNGGASVQVQWFHQF